MNELIEYAQSLMNYLQTTGATLNVESQQALAHMLQNILQLIQEQSQGTQVTEVPPSQPDIQEAMPSSNVEGFAYDDKSGKLLVRFLGKHPNRNGPIYSYDGVPREIFDMFQKGAVPARTDGKNKWGRWWKGKVPSIGASLYTLIKTRGYPYQRVA